MVSLCCTEPAKIAGLFPQKGVIKAGSDADLVILDPDTERIMTTHDLHGAADYTCYEGVKMQGDICLVMQRGTVLVKDHVFLGQKGTGQYLKRRKSSLVVTIHGLTVSRLSAPISGALNFFSRNNVSDR